MNYCLVLPTAEDIRSARSYLNWTQMELAYQLGVNIMTIASIENNKSKPTRELLDRITKLFMENSIKFLPNGGFSVERDIIRVFEGIEGYIKIIEDVIQTCGPNKEEVLLLGSDDRRSNKKIDDVYQGIYAAGIPNKLLTAESNNYILGPLECYRQVDKSSFLSPTFAILIYKDKVMFASKAEYKNNKYDENVKLLLINDSGMYKQFRAYFYELWNKGIKLEKSSAKQVFFYKK
ncbi:helix-turn-helix domain-containing protein [Pseudomonadota bacterium]